MADVEVWREAFDPRSGRAYYYNSRTRETQWEMPPNFEKEGNRRLRRRVPKSSAVSNENENLNRGVQQTSDHDKVDDGELSEVETVALALQQVYKDHREGSLETLAIADNGAVLETLVQVITTAPKDLKHSRQLCVIIQVLRDALVDAAILRDRSQRSGQYEQEMSLGPCDRATIALLASGLAMALLQAISHLQADVRGHPDVDSVVMILQILCLLADSPHSHTTMASDDLGDTSLAADAGGLFDFEQQPEWLQLAKSSAFANDTRIRLVWGLIISKICARAPEAACVSGCRREALNILGKVSEGLDKNGAAAALRALSLQPHNTGSEDDSASSSSAEFVGPYPSPAVSVLCLLPIADMGIPEVNAFLAFVAAMLLRHEDLSNPPTCGYEALTLIQAIAVADSAYISAGASLREDMEAESTTSSTKKSFAATLLEQCMASSNPAIATQSRNLVLTAYLQLAGLLCSSIGGAASLRADTGQMNTSRSQSALGGAATPPDCAVAAGTGIVPVHCAVLAAASPVTSSLLSAAAAEAAADAAENGGEPLPLLQLPLCNAWSASAVLRFLYTGTLDVLNTVDERREVDGGEDEARANAFERLWVKLAQTMELADVANTLRLPYLKRMVDAQCASMLRGLENSPDIRNEHISAANKQWDGDSAAGQESHSLLESVSKVFEQAAALGLPHLADTCARILAPGPDQEKDTESAAEDSLQRLATDSRTDASAQAEVAAGTDGRSKRIVKTAANRKRRAKKDPTKPSHGGIYELMKNEIRRQEGPMWASPKATLLGKKQVLDVLEHCDAAASGTGSSAHATQRLSSLTSEITTTEASDAAIPESEGAGVSSLYESLESLSGMAFSNASQISPEPSTENVPSYGTTARKKRGVAAEEFDPSVHSLRPSSPPLTKQQLRDAERSRRPRRRATSTAKGSVSPVGRLGIGASDRGGSSRRRSTRTEEGRAGRPSPSAIRARLTLLKRKVKKRASFQALPKTRNEHMIEALAVESRDGGIPGDVGEEDSPRFVRSAPTTPTDTTPSKVRKPLRPRMTAKHRARMEAAAAKATDEPRKAEQNNWQEQSEQFRQAVRNSRT